MLTEAPSILAYGTIGFGLLLSIIAASLLNKNFTIESRKRSNSTPIYVFMVFSIALVSIGAFLEYSRMHTDPYPDPKEFLRMVSARINDAIRQTDAAAGSWQNVGACTDTSRSANLLLRALNEEIANKIK